MNCYCICINDNEVISDTIIIGCQIFETHVSVTTSFFTRKRYTSYDVAMLQEEIKKFFSGFEVLSESCKVKQIKEMINESEYIHGSKIVSIVMFERSNELINFIYDNKPFIVIWW